MIKILFIALAFLLAFCCVNEKEQTPMQQTQISEQDTKDKYHAEFLFEQDGVKIYRFWDNGQLRYFCTGDGSFLPLETKLE